MAEKTVETILGRIPEKTTSAFHKIPGAYDNFSKRKRRDLLRYLFLRERQMSYVNTCICNLKKKTKYNGEVEDFTFQYRGCGFDPWSES